MTQTRVALFVGLAAGVFIAACGTPTGACTPQNCASGCCTGDVCVAGTEHQACGTSGNECVSCSASGQVCANRVCTSSSTGGGTATEIGRAHV
jgi:hypothetical protein